MDYMIQLQNNERIIKAFTVKKSAHGSGVFYITNFGVYFETQRYGIIIEVNFKLLRSYNAIKKDIFQIVWNIKNGERVKYEITVDSANEVMTVYKDANDEYAESMTEIQILDQNRSI